MTVGARKREKPWCQRVNSRLCKAKPTFVGCLQFRALVLNIHATGENVLTHVADRCEAQ